MDWILQLPILFFSVVIHEFSHGWLALRHGDDTAYHSGRLTLNPLPHIDPFGTILLPVLCILSHAPVFGWAKPVPVNPLRLNNPSRDMVRVAAVGPLSNILLAFLAALLFRLSFELPGLPREFHSLLRQVLHFTVQINLFLAVFNLLPIHPLDGSQVLSGLLPDSLGETYDRLAPYGFFLIVFLLWTGLLSRILMPPVSILYQSLRALGLLP
ncbi:MAG: site-2 protease family protein [Elusimicrobia bacterium]|nr:site-2 protease family protein [Elusimicrobiota bacterium]